MCVRVPYLARVRSAAVTSPSATALTWATAALITWRDDGKDRLFLCLFLNKRSISDVSYGQLFPFTDQVGDLPHTCIPCHQYYH